MTVVSLTEYRANRERAEVAETLARLEAQRVRMWGANLYRDTADDPWGVENAGNTEGLTSDEKAAALLQGWMAIVTNERLTPVGDVVVGYVVLRKDGSYEHWIDPEATPDVIESLEAAVTNMTKSLTPDKVGGV